MVKPVQIFWSKLPKIAEILTLNKILYVLMASDFIIISAYGLIAPIFAVFLSQNIIGGSLVVIGISESIYLISKSLLQVPIGIVIDRTRGQKIDFWFLFFGSFLISLSVLFYIWASLPWHIYVISLFYGIGSSLSFPAWTGLFTRNMVADKESFAWSFSTTFVEIGRALAAVLGAIIAQILGFDALFIVVAGLSFLGTFLLFFFYEELVKE